MVFQSLAKGHRFERDVANWLTSKTGVKWHRTPMSGATASCNNLSNFRGDVFSEAQQYSDLVVEAKNYKNPVNLQDINNPKSDFNSWISQTEKEAGNRFWLLFIRWNRSPIFIIAPTTYFVSYIKEGALKAIFHSCRPVFETYTYSMLEVIEEDKSGS